jgi:hypothetical protein
MKFLDVKKIFSNNTVKGFLKAADKVAYREESLDAVARAYIGQGKPEGVSGINAEFLQPNEQLVYFCRMPNYVTRYYRKRTLNCCRYYMRFLKR